MIRKASEGGSQNLYSIALNFQADIVFPCPGYSEETIPVLTEATP